MHLPNDKVIVTDVDGVLLDWSYGFHSWMSRHGYDMKNQDSYLMFENYGISYEEALRLVHMFNESARIRRLSPLRDAVKYVKKLHYEHGYVFHAISSMTDDEYAQHLRTKNLRELFGDTVFETYVYLGCGAPKHDALIPYKDSECFWIEDKEENADIGVEYGLQGLLMKHHYNRNYQGPARKVNNWKEVYRIITGEE